MEYVHPIRDRAILDELKAYLKKKNERDYIMLMVGINTGLRVGDILPLRVKDVRRDYLIIREEQKTGKSRRIPINPSLRKALDGYIKEKEDHELLFKSRQRSRKGKVKPIDRTTAYRILREAADTIGYDDPIGTHTMRKTFGYLHYKDNRNAALLQKIYNHDKETTTLAYIGVEQDIIDDSIMRLRT